MIALLSKDYFSSDWCVHELDFMMERSHGNSTIIPIVVHDGEAIPDAIAQLQYANFKEFAIPALHDAGPLHARFWSAMVELAPRISHAIENSPTFEDEWMERCKERFINVYSASLVGYRVPPKEFVLKPSSPPRVPPRLVP